MLAVFVELFDPESEVDQLYLLVLGNEDVVWFEVSMRHHFTVGIGNGFQNLPSNADQIEFTELFIFLFI